MSPKATPFIEKRREGLRLRRLFVGGEEFRRGSITSTGARRDSAAGRHRGGRRVRWDAGCKRIPLSTLSCQQKQPRNHGRPHQRTRGVAQLPNFVATTLVADFHSPQNSTPIECHASMTY